MKLIPRKRIILAFHRWLGVASALFLAVLALTGLALNHSRELGLDRIHVKSQFVRGLYGMAKSSDIVTWRIHALDTVSSLDGRIYYNGGYLGRGDSMVGLHEGELFSLIACSDTVILITSEGELIEVLETSRLPFESIQALGISVAGNPVLVSPAGAWQPDKDWIQFKPFEEDYRVKSPEVIDLPETTVESILSDYQGVGPVLSKVLLDLHSGRLFGWGGRTVMDLTAIAILLLVSSGISGWLRKSRWGINH